MSSHTPNTAEECRLLAIELRKQGRFDEALAMLESGLRIQPDYAPIYYNIASIRLAQGRAADAAAAWRQAIELKPAYYQAWSGFGTALRHLGRLNEAID